MSTTPFTGKSTRIDTKKNLIKIAFHKRKPISMLLREFNADFGSYIAGDLEDQYPILHKYEPVKSFLKSESAMNSTCINCGCTFTVGRSYGLYGCSMHTGALIRNSPKYGNKWTCCGEEYGYSSGCSRCEHQAYGMPKGGHKHVAISASVYLYCFKYADKMGFVGNYYSNQMDEFTVDLKYVTEAEYKTLYGIAFKDGESQRMAALHNGTYTTFLGPYYSQNVEDMIYINLPQTRINLPLFYEMADSSLDSLGELCSAFVDNRGLHRDQRFATGW